MSEYEALKRAVRIAGGQTALARLIHRKQAHIWNWLNVSKRVPAEAVLAIEDAVSGQVTRFELRPDIYRLEPKTSRGKTAA